VAAARRATAARRAVVADTPARGDASRPPWGAAVAEGNAAALPAAQDAGDPTVRPAADAKESVSPPFTAEQLGAAGVPTNPRVAAAPLHGEMENACDAAALEALPAAAPTVASKAAGAAAEVPGIDIAVVAEREASHDSAAFASCSLNLESSCRRFISFLRHCFASPSSRTSLAFQGSTPARSMDVSDKVFRAAAVVATYLWTPITIEAASLAAFVPIVWDCDARRRVHWRFTDG